MGSNARLIKNQRGMVLVYIALLMVALCAFVALAVDVGYMYLAKGQLQNAADAAALAGAVRLPAETEARDAAQSFAALNTAATDHVTISNGGGNALSPENDITLGNWSQARVPRYIPGQAPFNAIEVRARRTAASDVGGESLDGPINLFFARVVAPQWAQMGVSAKAIARRPGVRTYFVVGKSTCTASLPLSLSHSTNNMAWTSLLENSTNADDLVRKITESDPTDVEVCGASIYTTNGTLGRVYSAVGEAFSNPDYDRVYKTYDADGRVLTWTQIVPVSHMDNPSEQPSPMEVWGYARVVLSQVNGNVITISEINCVDCANPTELLQVYPILVE